MSAKKQTGKIIVIVAPSGGGKTTLARRLLSDFREIKFSVSATTRSPRKGEQHGREYFFLSKEQFNNMIEQNGFLEWEEFYNGTRYGTLRSEVDKLMEYGYFPLLDIEVNGALNVKNIYRDKCVAIFIQPPSLDVLEERLRKRKTESEETLKVRLERAEKEIKYAAKFDYVVINDDLDRAYDEAKEIVAQFIHK